MFAGQIFRRWPVFVCVCVSCRGRVMCSINQHRCNKQWSSAPASLGDKLTLQTVGLFYSSRFMEIETQSGLWRGCLVVKQKTNNDNMFPHVTSAFNVLPDEFWSARLDGASVENTSIFILRGWLNGFYLAFIMFFYCFYTFPFKLYYIALYLYRYWKNTVMKSLNVFCLDFVYV